MPILWRWASPSCSPHHGEVVAHKARSVIQARLHVGAREFWILLQNVLDGITRSEELQDRLLSHSLRVPQSLNLNLSFPAFVE